MPELQKPRRAEAEEYDQARHSAAEVRVRHCAWCGNLIVRRCRNGIDERGNTFLRRKFCSVRCGRRHFGSSQLARRKARRALWIKENGPCRQCGSTVDLQIDHIDPSKKVFRISDCWASMKPERLAELEKCQVLCQKCHQRKTIRESFPERQHGSIKMYTKGKCRCSLCRAANAERRRGQYRRKNAQLQQAQTAG